jgi:hypothetical protein
MNLNLLRLVSRMLFFLGVSLGLALGAITIWNEMEAVHYFFTGATREPFHGLRCPILVSPTEKGEVQAVFNNPTDQEVNFFYRVELSGQENGGQGPDHIVVPARQTKKVYFAADSRNVDLGFFIFVKMTIFPNPLHSFQEAVCGIMVTDLLGLSGGQISAAALTLSFLGMVIGFGVGQKAGDRKDQSTTRVMQVLMLIVLLTLVAGVMGWWIAGMALLAITVLLMIITVRLVIA